MKLNILNLKSYLDSNESVRIKKKRLKKYYKLSLMYSV